MSFVSDFNRHLDTMLERLGEEAVYTPESGTPVTVRGIFDNAYVAIEGDSVQVAGTAPRFTCKSSDIPDIQTDDSISIYGKDYTVVEIQPDGTGVTSLLLEEKP